MLKLGESVTLSPEIKVWLCVVPVAETTSSTQSPVLLTMTLLWSEIAPIRFYFLPPLLADLLCMDFTRLGKERIFFPPLLSRANNRRQGEFRLGGEGGRQ